ncbi:MAG: uroporphyrinogen-III C-methyltransferase [Actinobacteria bacterium]|nr:uroporphyrinogen-III C-methyltransferase [Actinomycetota bacterium]
MTVYLVGAGPGDPGLLTVRGAQLLRSADVVVHDRLASRAVLDLVLPHARRVSVGKAPGRAEMSQDDINTLLVEEGRTGRCVVRLKGGDPFVFGRGGEEAEALAAAGIPFEVVPGITSAIAAPAYAGIPVTHRGVSTHFTVVTGHEDPAKGRTDVDWEALARAGGTLVILMGVGNLAGIVDRLRAGGLAAATPVAAIRYGTRPDQETQRATLETVTKLDVKAPSALVIGPVAGLDLSWFESRPLFGRRVVVTRAREQASGLRARLELLGAEVVELPTIAIEPVDIALPALGAYEWVVLTSVNGVAALFDRGLAPAGLDARALGGVQVAAIGPGTAAALADRGIRADLVPERFVAEALLDAFPPPASPSVRAESAAESARRGAKVLVARAEQARDVLPEGLRSRGYEVDVLTLYRTVPAPADPAQREAVRRGDIDAITFTSSSTVANFHDLVGALPDPHPLVVSIGPVTSGTARERGLPVDVEASEHTIDGVVDALVAALEPRPHR